MPQPPPLPRIVARLIRYAVTFLFYGFAGFALEHTMFGKNSVDNRSVWFDRIGVPKRVGVPFYPLWGFGALFLAIINDLLNFPTLAGSQALTYLVSLVAKVTVATASMTALECVSGHEAMRGKHGKRSWDYRNSEKDGSPTFCDGFCSVKVSAMWALLSTLFFICDPCLRFPQLLGLPT